MTDPVNVGGIVDIETALQREIDVLAQRFPQVERTDLERRVRDTYSQLKHGAEIQAHLLAVTSAQVTRTLGEEGVAIHVRGADADPD